MYYRFDHYVFTVAVCSLWHCYFRFLWLFAKWLSWTTSWWVSSVCKAHLCTCFSDSYAWCRSLRIFITSTLYLRQKHVKLSCISTHTGSHNDTPKHNANTRYGQKRCQYLKIKETLSLADNSCIEWHQIPLNVSGVWCSSLYDQLLSCPLFFVIVFGITSTSI